MNNSVVESQAGQSGKAPVFIPLHNHSEYSLLDGTIRIKDLVREAAARGHTHVAVTDHGSMHGAIELYLTARGAGLIPIIGCEIYCEGAESSREWARESCKDEKIAGFFHLVLLAKNTNGYKNLLKIVSSGFVGGQLRDVPVISADTLVKYGADLVALSSCLRGEYAWLARELRQRAAAVGGASEPSAVLARNPLLKKAWDEHLGLMKKAFGEANYYVELIDNNLPAQKDMIPYLVSLAGYFGLPLIASADAHYMEPDFAATHALAIAIKNGITLNDIRERQQDACFHLRTDGEMQELFSRWPEALANTLKVARECSHVEIEMDTFYLPKIDPGTGESPAKALRRLAKEGLEERFSLFVRAYGGAYVGENRHSYESRLEHELSVIIQMGFFGLFFDCSGFYWLGEKKWYSCWPRKGVREQVLWWPMLCKSRIWIRFHII